VVISDRVSGFGHEVGAPSGCFLGVVAGLAESLAVGCGRLAAPSARLGVVDVGDRGIAPGGAAGLVPEDGQIAELAAERTAPTVHRDELAGVGSGVEAAEPGLVGLADDPPGQGRGDGAVARNIGRFVVSAEQGALVHHQLDLDADSGDFLPGQAGEERVGHDLADRAGVTFGAQGLCVLAQCGVHGHSLHDRQEAGDVAHRVGRRPDGDTSLVLGLLVATHRGAGVEAVGDLASEVGDPAVTGSLELRCEFGIDLHPVLAGQGRGLADDQGGPPLRDPSVRQRVVGLRHLADQTEGDADMPLAARG